MILQPGRECPANPRRPRRAPQYGICQAIPMLLPGSFSGVVPCAVAVPLPRRVCSFRFSVRSTFTCTWLVPFVVCVAATYTLFETYLPAVMLAPPDVLPPPPDPPPPCGEALPTDSVLRPNHFLNLVSGFHLLPPPPPPPGPMPLRLASAAPVSASCSAVSWEAGLPKRSSPSRSSCGRGGLEESAIFGESAKPVTCSVTVVGPLYMTLDCATKSSVGSILPFSPCPLKLTLPVVKLRLVPASAKVPRIMRNPPLTRGRSEVPRICSLPPSCASSPLPWTKMASGASRLMPRPMTNRWAAAGCGAWP